MNSIISQLRIWFIAQIFIVFPFWQAIGQQSIELSTPLKLIATDKVSDKIKKDSELTILGFSSLINNGAVVNRIQVRDAEGTEHNLDPKKLETVNFVELNTVNKVWNKYLITSGVLFNLASKGYQYGLRHDLNSEAADFINALESYDQFYRDYYLEDYLYTLVNKLYDGGVSYDRPGFISVRILKSQAPNAFMLPNGSMMITTGLLSTVLTEDELMGVLAHEVAHFVLDHQVMNYNNAMKLKQRAEFWSAFSTAIAATTEMYIASKNPHYVPGAITMTTALTSIALSQEVAQRLGLEYSKDQEIAADLAARSILRCLHYNDVGLSVALARIQEFHRLTGNYQALSGDGTHPSLNSRISSLGEPHNIEQYFDSKFIKKTSFINTFTAQQSLISAHYQHAEKLVTRNIDMGTATGVDYVIKAMIMRMSADTKESNEKALVYLQTAKGEKVDLPMDVYKEEALVLLRLGRKADAKAALQAYLKGLTDIMVDNEIKQIKNYNKTLDEETQWVRSMIYKVDKL